MNFKIDIKQIGAAFLLLVFLLGTTPKKNLHDAITQHEHIKVDIEKCSHHHINISAAGFNCQLDNLVVELPFEILLQPIFLFAKEYKSSYHTSLHNQEAETAILLISLRGPPIC